MRDSNTAYAARRPEDGPAAARTQPFPVASLQPGTVQRVPAGAATPEHWFTSWAMSLPATPEPAATRAPVWGATVEIRIGAHGKPVTVIARTRPWKRVLTEPAYPTTPDDQQNHGDHHNNGSDNDHAEAPPLVYIADHPFESQRHWSPCWLLAPEDEAEYHHGRRLWPACAYSILPEILVVDDQETASLWAELLGARQHSEVVEHGDTWRLRWSIASLPDLLTGAVSHAEATSVTIEAGLHHVALEVTHVPTGATRTTTTQVVAGVPPVPMDPDDGMSGEPVG